MCAAPGGKSLMLSYMMFAHQHQSATGPPADSEANLYKNTSVNLSDDSHAVPANAQPLGHTTLPSQSAPQSPSSSAQTATTLHFAATHTSNGETPQAALADQTSRATTASHLHAAAANLATADAEVSEQSQQLPQLQTVRPDQEGTAVEQASQPLGTHGLGQSYTKPTGSLTCNELDPARRARLQTVLKQYLPPRALNKIK